MRVSLVQMTAVRNDKQANLMKMEKFIKKAANEKASIICFPEMSITGYLGKQPFDAAESLEGPSMKRLSQMAMDSGITVLAGIAEKSADAYYISHVTAHPDGNLEVYRKTHLGAREKKIFSAGETIPVFSAQNEGRKVKFGIGICYDLHYPELVTSVAVQGAKLVFAPHAIPIGGKRRLSIWEKYLPARAYDNGVYVLSCNLVGNDGKKHFGGGIGVWNPKGENILRCDDEKELMLMLDLDMDIFDKRSGMGKTPGFIEDRRVKLYLDSAGFKIEGESIG